MQAARDGDRGHHWFVARQQTGGRGRQGRRWVSPSGNLYTSLLLIDPSRPAVAPQLGFVAGLALVDSLRALLGGDERVKLKWPNDILHDGKKLAGILLEGANLPNGRFACVIGIGVNCQSHPETLPYRATDLRTIGTALDRPEDVLLGLTDRFAAGLALWRRGENFAAVREAWLRHAAGLGRNVAVETAKGRLEGEFTGLDTNGRLVLRVGDRDMALEAGDIIIGPRPV
jgi:BirA family biotin operon repressor/biotin-[acetyl-CoA-carboxylase] ligase